MNRAKAVKLVFYIFVLVLAFGVYLEYGPGWACMVLGLIGAASALTLHDVDEDSS